LNTPQRVIAEHALRFKISDHRGRCRLLNRRATIGQIEAHHPEHPGAARIVSEYPEIIYQVTRGGTAALPVPFSPSRTATGTVRLGSRKQASGSSGIQSLAEAARVAPLAGPSAAAATLRRQQLRVEACA
jgi:hypothetical protein